MKTYINAHLDVKNLDEIQNKANQIKEKAKELKILIEEFNSIALEYEITTSTSNKPPFNSMIREISEK